MKERIAVVGGGIAGLTAAYLLHPRHEVTLFERTGRLGGNAWTFQTRMGDSVDIAVAAFGKAGYRNFFRLLDRLGVRTRMSMGSFMSLHDMDTGRGFYVTPSLTGLVAQRFALLASDRLRALARVRAGVVKLVRMLDEGRLDGKTLEQALSRVPELAGDARRIILCALCLLSSMSCGEVLLAPAEFFAGKLKVHHDVISPRAVWSVHCIAGGTRRYVEALAGAFRERVVLDARIRTVLRSDAGVDLVMEGGERRAFDRVVLACNADQALAMLESPTVQEARLLGAWRYKEGRVVVHRDHGAFPPRPLMQAYTFLYTERAGRMETSVNGSLWHEPGVRRGCDYISSQHPNFPIRGERIELDTVLRTPIFDFPAFGTRAELPSLNGVLRTYYCGSHFGHGLHEDAVSSAIDVARRLGVEW